MEDAAFNTAEQGRPLLFRVVMAASQSIAAMGTPLLVPCWIILLVKSSRCRNVRLLVRRATPGFEGEHAGGAGV